MRLCHSDRGHRRRDTHHNSTGHDGRWRHRWRELVMVMQRRRWRRRGIVSLHDVPGGHGGWNVMVDRGRDRHCHRRRRLHHRLHRHLSILGGCVCVVGVCRGRGDYGYVNGRRRYRHGGGGGRVGHLVIWRTVVVGVLTTRDCELGGKQILDEDILIDPVI